TRIAASAVSVAFAAVELARKILGDLSGKTVMLIGAGEMCELAAKHFIGCGAERIMVANRTFERAERLAEEFCGQAVPFERLFEHLHQADIVLSSTGAEQAFIGPAEVEAAVRRRRYSPMFFIDIAVPRDIDPRVNDLENAYLFTLDDLQEVVQSNIAQRNVEADKAVEIVDMEVARFYRWLSSLDVTPTIVALRRRFEEIRQAELDRNSASWKGLSPEDEQRLDLLTRSIINKLLHPAMAVLKQSGQGGRTDLYVDALRQLFDLQEAEADDSGQQTRE
ncbi:MAG TPA: glutamyl-tRNA reductase, partial [Deltaproteobacteria bacterium]|nr:glutamyl-tRNA reductase [Deltaproteobacteria bacterium]